MSEQDEKGSSVTDAAVKSADETVRDLSGTLKFDRDDDAYLIESESGERSLLLRDRFNDGRLDLREDIAEGSRYLQEDLGKQADDPLTIIRGTRYFVDDNSLIYMEEAR